MANYLADNDLSQLGINLRQLKLKLDYEVADEYQNQREILGNNITMIENFLTVGEEYEKSSPQYREVLDHVHTYLRRCTTRTVQHNQDGSVINLIVVFINGHQILQRRWNIAKNGLVLTFDINDGKHHSFRLPGLTKSGELFFGSLAIVGFASILASVVYGGMKLVQLVKKH